MTVHIRFLVCAFACLFVAFALVSCGGDDDDDSADDDADTDDDGGDDDVADDDAGEESVFVDDTTGLGWQNGPAVGGEQMSYANADAYCDDLLWAGFDDWRLPTISELRSLIRGCPDTQTGGSCQVRDDCTNSSCWTARCSCQDSGGNAPGGAYWPSQITGAIDFYWSRTPVANEAGGWWPVTFQFGGIFKEQIPFYAARCVRGAESGVTDETGEAHPVAHVIVSDISPITPVQQAECAIYELDGVPLDEPVLLTGGVDGWCLGIFNFPSATYSMKVTAPGFRDMHIVNLPPLPMDESDAFWAWVDIMLGDERLAELTAAAGVTQDPSKGIVWGTAHWLDDVDFWTASADEMVGCATVTPDTELFYVDETILPDPTLTQTGTQIAGWYAFNVEPGTVEYVTTANGESESTGEAPVYPNALTIVMSKFRAPEYPENPMPDGCL